jgi:hypothetical protein
LIVDFDVEFNRNADVPRALVRDMYTKSWSAFDRLVAIVPPGGSIGYVTHLLCNSSDSQCRNFFSSSTASTTNSSVSGSFKGTPTPTPTLKASTDSKQASK